MINLKKRTGMDRKILKHRGCFVLVFRWKLNRQPMPTKRSISLEPGQDELVQKISIEEKVSSFAPSVLLKSIKPQCRIS